MKNPDIRKEWEACLIKYKEYLINDEDENWRSTLKQVCEYMDKENKRPSEDSKNPDIKTLGVWIGTQIQNYKKNIRIMKNPDIRKEWEAVLEKYSEYLSDGIEKWRSTLKQVYEYMDKEKKRPVKDEKKLGAWIGNQKNNYKKNTQIMKNPIIRKEWETMLDKYGEYLKDRPTQSALKTPPPKSYADLTEDERRKMCEKVLKSRQEEKGYRSTNPDDKDKINEIFAKSVSLINCYINSKIAFLDHVEFKTAFALLEMGIKPEQMLIPQRADNYDEMSKHELFGPYVVMGEFNDVLNQYMLGGGKVRGVYADYCSTLEKDGLPFLELIRTHRLNLIKGAVIGVTITLRNPEGVRYAGQDISVMSLELLRMFPSSSNLFVEGGLLLEDDGPYTYGGGAPMATWLVQVE